MVEDDEFVDTDELDDDEGEGDVMTSNGSDEGGSRSQSTQADIPI